MVLPQVVFALLIFLTMQSYKFYLFKSLYTKYFFVEKYVYGI